MVMMEWSLVKCCLWVSLVLLFQILDHGGVFGCFEDERIALLEIKKAYSFNWTTDDAGHDDGRGSSTDCCDWEPAVIKCNATTGRVIQLSFNDIKGFENGFEHYVSLNVTLFSAFKELQLLNLSYNRFDGLIENEGFERLVGLGKLEVLDLSGNLFNDSVLQSLGTLKSLRKLSLSGNNLEGSSHFEGFKRLVGLGKLEVLDLSGNLFNDSVLQSLGTLKSLRKLSLSGNNLEGSSHFEGFKRFGGLQMLEVLDLSHNFLNNSILPSLGTVKSLRKLSLSANNLEGSSYFEEFLSNMHMLQSLDLSFNFINGTLPGLCQLRNLHELDLSRNDFEGVLPPCLKNLTTLRKLDLSYNHLNGSIPSSLIPSLTSLVSISLSFNDFDGLFPFISFANHSNLESIDLCCAGDKFKVETEYPSWVPPFQLKALLLSNNNLNVIPRFLNNQYNLRQVDLSSNNLSGTFPNWLLENNKMLGVLILRNNSLSGHIVLPSNIVHKAAYSIDISNNGINGLLQESIGRILPNIENLNLSHNYFEGGVPSSIANMKRLKYLDLANNNFSGEIPVEMATSCNNLLFLLLSNNRLQGEILPPYFNWTQLIGLYLDNNSFSGNILTGLSKFSELKFLDIGNNWIRGRIPNWIGNLTNLYTLVMRGNSLQGNIPVEFYKLQQVEFIDLSQNLLLGSIPSILNSTTLQHLHLEGNRFTRTPPPTLRFNDSSLLTLDIGDNDLYGVMPNWIGGLSDLTVLRLKQNHFSGSIPNYICQLSRIYVMDLSHNALSGSIPQCLNNISFGRGATLEILDQIDFFDHFFYSSIEVSLLGYYEENSRRLTPLEEVELIMKKRSDSYKGISLNLLSALDLSCNNLTNGIPSEIGELEGIIDLNLSHNQLTGPIPRTLSNLTQVESLDLSYNNLSGEIPSELSILCSLEVFTVAHNNLSGKLPEMKAQFGTFTSTSYEGNPFLCGPPLPRDCSSTVPSIGVRNDDDDDYDIDISALYASFAASYVITLFGFAAVLYINPYWRRMWFRFIEQCIDSCHEFVCDTWYKLVIRAST
ncbi:receptor-like protein 15 isoform X2 [Macadamia integrifolia]|uniref:receptor-like protein 15 isoform X2 n=1 Tax=Macadamia integrifolia TaxID=60698 RepID=UPI001C502186|nr:receptor-like protein 15 isoform X2 [Macadamia integrifolia]